MKAQVFFPASRFKKEFIEKGRQQAESMGLEVLLPELPKPEWFHCASLEARRESLLNALRGPAEILWAARGGYGTAEWLSDLPDEPNMWEGKRLVGFSDLTALHAWCSNRMIQTFHAPMIATRGWWEATAQERNSWEKAVIDSRPEGLPFISGSPKLLSPGRLIGGNLTVLASLMGSPHQLQFQGGEILFLEDVQEPPYRLARSLFQISHSPNFEKIQIIWGQLTNCGEEDPKRLIGKLMAPYANPWALGLQVGHGRPNHSIPLGCGVHIESNRLEFTQV